MSISWQTGEPPCGEELLIEFLCDGRSPVWRDLATKRGIQWHLSGGPCSGVIEILRWSTLDDDRAAKAMGAMEKYIDAHPDDSVDLSKIDGKYVAILSDSCGYLYADSKREAPSLIEAIEQLTAGQQTKGASDAQA